MNAGIKINHLNKSSAFHNDPSYNRRELELHRVEYMRRWEIRWYYTKDIESKLTIFNNKLQAKHLYNSIIISKSVYEVVNIYNSTGKSFICISHFVS